MNSLIEEIFKNFKVGKKKIPVSFLRYEGKADTYITYMETDKENSYSGDDEIIGYVDYYDFDIYSKGNYLDILKELKKILKANGFYWEPSQDSQDMYENDTGYYHKTVCFSYMRNEEEENEDG